MIFTWVASLGMKILSQLERAGRPSRMARNFVFHNQSLFMIIDLPSLTHNSGKPDEFYISLHFSDCSNKTTFKVVKFCAAVCFTRQQLVETLLIMSAPLTSAYFIWNLTACRCAALGWAWSHGPNFVMDRGPIHGPQVCAFVTPTNCPQTAIYFRGVIWFVGVVHEPENLVLRH